MTPNEPAQYDVYEVFSQKDATSKFESQFSLLASAPEIALSLAQENFLRREEVPANIFVVKRIDIHYMPPEHRAALQRLDNKEYRQPASYGFIPSKWRELKEKNQPGANHLDQGGGDS